jgi:hypothetical protein
MHTVNSVTHDGSSSIGTKTAADGVGGISGLSVFWLTTPRRPSRTTAVIEIAGTPTEKESRGDSALSEFKQGMCHPAAGANGAAITARAFGATG